LRWVIDDQHTVHALFCAEVTDGSLEYVTWPTTPEAMHEWLSKPDSQGGLIMSKHGGPALVKPCALCLPAPVPEPVS
jgi:hypothetical protein